MLMRGLLVLLVAVSLLAAGCLGARGPPEPAGSEGPVIPEPAQRLHRVNEAFSTEVRGGSPGLVGAWVYPTLTPVTDEFSVDVPPGTRSLDIEMRWFRADNEFVMVVNHPGGQDQHSSGELSVVGTNDRLHASYPDPAPGTWTIHGAMEGILRGNDQIFVYTHKQYLEDPELPLIPVVEDGDGWFALYGETRQNIPLTEELELDVATAHGILQVEAHDAEETFLELRPWARAGDEERARTLAAAVHSDIELGSTKTRAIVHAPMGLAEGESAGAHMILKVGRAVTGKLMAEEGSIVLSNLTSILLLDVSTVNGTVSGTVRPSDDLRVTTQNGDVDLEILAERDTKLRIAATEGAVKLRLSEDERTGYKIDASTTRGEITSGLDSAGLEGDATKSTLMTQDFEQRFKHVTGTVAATGDIEFLGL